MLLLREPLEIWLAKNQNGGIYYEKNTSNRDE